MDYRSYLIWTIIITILYYQELPLYPLVVIAVMTTLTGSISLVYWAYSNPADAIMGYTLLNRDIERKLEKIWPSIRVEELTKFKVVNVNGHRYYIKKSVHVPHLVMGIKDNLSIDITASPGTDYGISPAELGYDKFIVKMGSTTLNIEKQQTLNLQSLIVKNDEDLYID